MSSLSLRGSLGSIFFGSDLHNQTRAVVSVDRNTVSISTTEGYNDPWNFLTIEVDSTKDSTPIEIHLDDGILTLTDSLPVFPGWDRAIINSNAGTTDTSDDVTFVLDNRDKFEGFDNATRIDAMGNISQPEISNFHIDLSVLNNLTDLMPSLNQ